MFQFHALPPRAGPSHLVSVGRSHRRFRVSFFTLTVLIAPLVTTKQLSPCSYVDHSKNVFWCKTTKSSSVCLRTQAHSRISGFVLGEEVSTCGLWRLPAVVGPQPAGPSQSPGGKASVINNSRFYLQWTDPHRQSNAPIYRLIYYYTS